MAQNDDNIFQANECDAFDSDIDDVPTAQTIFMANLSSAGPAHQQVGPSHASTFSKVHNLDNDVDHVYENHKEHEIHNEIQQPTIIESNIVETGNSNIIPYDQYLKNNAAFVALDDISSILHVDSLATELATYKEQVEVYEQCAKYELNECEQKLSEQISILIHTRNRMEENLKKELHSVKLQLKSNVQSNKLIQENVTALQQDLKQKEDKLLGELVNMRNLKRESYQNPYYLNKAKRAQPALYDGNETLKTNHVPARVPTSDEDLELADISREKMNDKVKTQKHFDGVQRSLVKEVRAMKAVFENMEAEEVFYTVTDYVLTVSRFHELNVAYDVKKSRAVKLEAENSKLLGKIQNDDHDTMVKHFSKLEIDHLNLQLKYQHLKENIGNCKSKASKDAPELDAFFELNKWNDHIQAYRNTIH
ncbi:hypothetical protein Tco_1209544 [Tanacetum coccineum]